nr:hypothetical protein [Tanacetum cinerariifolium]
MMPPTNNVSSSPFSAHCRQGRRGRGGNGGGVGEAASGIGSKRRAVKFNARRERSVCPAAAIATLGRRYFVLFHRLAPPPHAFRRPRRIRPPHPRAAWREAGRYFRIPGGALRLCGPRRAPAPQLFFGNEGAGRSRPYQQARRLARAVVLCSFFKRDSHAQLAVFVAGVDGGQVEVGRQVKLLHKERGG